MKVIHGIWVPNQKAEFMQQGQFYIWVESDEIKPLKTKNLHPQHLRDQMCLDFLKTAFAYHLNPHDPEPQLKSIFLPTVDNKPVPAPEFAINDINEVVNLQAWNVFACPLLTPLKTIGDIYFLSHYQLEEVRIGRDFLFWFYFCVRL